MIFIDEVESLLGERGLQGEHEASKRSKAEFLVQLDGLQRQKQDVCRGQVLFLASTNLPWCLDPALLRRFQRIINVDLPNRDERLQILQKTLNIQGQMLDMKGLDLESLANHTDGFSGIV